MKKTLFVLALAATAAASFADVDRYRQFLLEGIYDSAVSNADANALVLEGIESDDPEVVYLTVAALSVVAMHQNFPELNTGRGKPPPRTFADVPGLRDFLIAHWREQNDTHGRRFGDELLAETLAETNGEPMTLLVEPARTSAWRSIPGMLCWFFPGDPKVHEFVWEIHALDVEANPMAWHGTHTLLNLGRFTTPEANAYRMSELAEPRGEGELRGVGIPDAAAGLALSHPPEALPLLIEALANHSREDIDSKILDAIAGYSDDRLAAHADRLAAAMRAYRPYDPSDAARSNLMRLEALVNDP